MSLAFGSLFTGIGGFDLALERAGMVCKWQDEIDPHCSELLAGHWPNVRRYGDVRDVGKHNLESVDLICGGFPCQDLSVAGRGEGLGGERSGLWYEFARIIGEMRPRWVVIENVPGLLSSNKGRDMGTIVGALGQFGYRWAYRMLDAQYFGVAQRRLRVFIVGSLGAGNPAEVLFEQESLRRDTPPSREKREEIAATVTSRIGKGGFTDPVNDNIIAHKAGDSAPVVVTELHGGSRRKDRPNGGFYVRDMETTKPLDTSGLNPGCAQGGILVGVRRLTPTECERLQGFPDGWTDGQADSTRYRQLGNAVCVPVVEWIGRRIVEQENMP